MNMRANGCLPRTTKVGDVCPRFSDEIKVIAKEDWRDDITLQPMVAQVLDQGQVGSCAAESSTQAVMISRAFAGMTFAPLNPYFVYYHTSGGRDAGSTIDSNLAFLRDKGCAPIDVWPRQRGWQTKPSDEAYEAAKQFRILEFYDITNVDEMVTALLMGFPVVYGAKGHAVCKIAHVSDIHGLDVNSWGEQWGENGFGTWVPYSGVGWGYGAFAVRTSTMGGTIFGA